MNLWYSGIFYLTKQDSQSKINCPVPASIQFLICDTGMKNITPLKMRKYRIVTAYCVRYGILPKRRSEPPPRQLCWRGDMFYDRHRGRIIPSIVEVLHLSSAQTGILLFHFFLTFGTFSIVNRNNPTTFRTSILRHILIGTKRREEFNA